jgi:nitrate/TMAO reductase-like tetraheme cytochrome c subunit
MNDDNSTGRSETDLSSTETREAAAALADTDAGATVEVGGKIDRSRGAKLRRLLLQAAAVLGALFLLLALVTAFAASYTSRPQFCRSCHIMEPYYVSWQHSSHSDVSCVKCHFPPGIGEKVRGKVQGLVQLLKYVTASAGPTPRAEIPDASCLRSGCHETRTLAGRVEFAGVPFDHRPHLLEMRRGKKLRCTSCHSQIVQGKHMTVTTSTCFLCHFKDGLFNEGLGACTRCHQIPEQNFDLGGGVSFNHDLAYEGGVGCANCHGDLIRGDGNVPPERCGVCHNRESDLARIDDHEFLHRTHVTDHNVDCLDCHLTIDHALDPDRIAHAASDCSSCHPDHHREQVDMLRGEGGKSIPTQSSSMTTARISCSTCHQSMDQSSTGTVLWKASIKICSACHEQRAIGQFRDYHEALRALLSDIESTVVRVRETLDATDLDADQAAAITLRLNKLQDDLNFLRVGNGIHNIHYAGTLTKALVEQLSTICRELDIDEPKLGLPEVAEISE